MRANEIYKLDEVSMSRSSLEEVLDDPNIFLGYELEFIGYQVIKRKKELTFADLIKQHGETDVDVSYNRTKAKKFKNAIIKTRIEKALTFKKEQLIQLIIDYYKSTHDKWKDFYTKTELYNFIEVKVENRKILINILKKIFTIELNEDDNFLDWIFKNERIDVIQAINLKLETFNYDVDETESIKFSKDKILMIYYEDYEGILKREFGFKFGRSKSTWRMEYDESIDGYSDTNKNGFELISPPMPIKESLDILMKLFDWMERNKLQTNESTGLHMGISFKEKEQTREVDPLKMLMFIDENYVLKAFERTANQYAETHEDHLRTISNQIKRGTIKGATIQEFLGLVRKKLTKDKYKSLNIGRLARSGYFEVRMLGNKNYHKRHDEVKRTALRYGKALQIAYSNEHQKEYVKKVYKMLQRVFGNIEKPAKSGDVIGTRLSRIANKEIWDSYVQLESGGEGSIKFNFKEFIKSFHEDDDYMDKITKSKAVTLLNILNAITKKYGLSLKRGNAAQLVKELQVQVYDWMV